MNKTAYLIKSLAKLSQVLDESGYTESSLYAIRALENLVANAECGCSDRSNFDDVDDDDYAGSVDFSVREFLGLDEDDDYKPCKTCGGNHHNEDEFMSEEFLNSDEGQEMIKAHYKDFDEDDLENLKELLDKVANYDKMNMFFRAVSLKEKHPDLQLDVEQLAKEFGYEDEDFDI